MSVLVLALSSLFLLSPHANSFLITHAFSAYKPLIIRVQSPLSYYNQFDDNNNNRLWRGMEYSETVENEALVQVAQNMATPPNKNNVIDDENASYNGQEVVEEGILNFEDVEENDTCYAYTEMEEVILNLDRECARVGAWENFIEVGAFVSTSSFGFAFEEQASNGPFHAVILLVTSLSAILGLHSTVVFSLSLVYAKSALGRAEDASYEDFIKSTSPERELAFKSFMVSLLAFAASVVLVASEKFFASYEQLPVIIVGSIFFLFSVKDWTLIINEASPIYDSRDVS